jgi:hypothetical protein
MQFIAKEKIKPGEALYAMRKSVSKILNRPFTERIDHQVFKPDQKILALWASDCVGHVLQYFEEKYPDDDRPRKAIETLNMWLRTGLFKMDVIRKASLDSHTSARHARENGEEAACYAARAAGQAVATAHVPTHALGSSVYAIRAAAAHTGNREDGFIKECNWQLRRLRLLARQKSPFISNDAIPKPQDSLDKG